MLRFANGIVDLNGDSTQAMDRLPRGGVRVGVIEPFHPGFCKAGAAVWTWKLVTNAVRLLVQGLFQEHNLTAAIRAGKYIAPDRIIDEALLLAVGVERLIHPADLGLEFVQDPSRLGLKRGHVERRVVVGRDEGGSG